MKVGSIRYLKQDYSILVYTGIAIIEDSLVNINLLFEK
jgi:hypothetical protein